MFPWTYKENDLMKVSYYIDNAMIECQLQGDTVTGEETVLLKQDTNLLSGLSIENSGFGLFPFLSGEENDKIRQGIKGLIEERMKELHIAVDPNFSLEKYHHYVDDAAHLSLAKSIQFGWHVDKFPLDFDLVNQRLSEIVQRQVTGEAKHVGFYNFFVRIVRPGKIQDNNPPHRDVWLDRLRNAVNIYFPICGSTSESALPLVPGSHLLPESSLERTAEGAFLNGTRYTVPCALSVEGQPVQLIRPNPSPEEVMVFSPYLIHGGGYNLNHDQTRVSLEARFFAKN
jgi:hypothetical protein